MKKGIIALMALSIMSMSSVYAAESQGPVSKWLDNVSSSVSRQEQTAYQKQQAKKQKLAAKQQARQQKIAKKKAEARQREIARQKKAAEHRQKAKAKKNAFKELFTFD